MNKNRRKIVKYLSAGLSGALLGFSSPAHAAGLELEEAVGALNDRRRRIILNNDGNDRPGDVVTPETFLKSRTSGLRNTQVDTIFYCSGVFNLYTHDSKVSEIIERDDKKWAKELIRQGNDSLSVMVDWCHRNNKEIFWSMRMNDTHDAGDSSLMSRWKKSHPEFMMGKEIDFFPHGNFRWSSLNYEIDEVRNKAFAILEDVCRRYDVDGIELDFFRHPIFFKETMQGGVASDGQRAVMTAFVRRIRTMTRDVARRRGRDLLVAIRIPDSLGYCHDLGLDVSEWLTSDLLDILVVGGYFKLEPWKNWVEIGNRHKKPVYACLVKRRIVEPDKGEDSDYVREVYRGEAYNALKAGISGIYVFNMFDPSEPLLNEIGDLRSLKGRRRMDRTSFEQPIWSRPEVWLASAEKHFKGIHSPDDPRTVVSENLVPYRERLKFRYKRRIIYNNDGNENLVRQGVTPETFLENRTTGLENTKIGTVSYCTGLTVMFTHRTAIADRFGYNGLGDARKSFPRELDKFNVDSLTLQIQYARDHHREIFWSFRMNDTHDSTLKHEFFRNTWKKRNPDCLMGAPGDHFPYGAGRWSALDYSKQKVRDFIYDVIEEVCVNYNVDGIELDFFRHPLFFREVMMGSHARPESLAVMSELITRIRKMTETVSLKRGRPLLVAIRIPDSFGYCRAIGLDVQEWLERDLVDIVIGGGYFKLEPWRNLAAIGKQYNVPVYACITYRRIFGNSKVTPTDEELMRHIRGDAFRALEAGVDGIYTFNHWYNRNGKTKELFDELGDFEQLKSLPKVNSESFLNPDYPVFPPEYWVKGGDKFLKES